MYLVCEDGCDGDGNYSTFMAITWVDSKEELRELNEELGEHTDVEEDEVSDDEEVTLMKVIGNFKLFMMHCLGIVANTPKSLSVQSRR